MESNFTISEGTNKLLAIYRDFNRVANELWKYFKPEEQEDADEIAESRFKPFTNSINELNSKLLAEISTRIADAVVFNDEATQI